ncbi:hypothetical protein [Flagellimonas sp.]|uniref:hypothetical protein n=1 Tax=Flagellimonas sp. TaxID=2058762 RepID=UPI003F4A1E61
MIQSKYLKSLPKPTVLVLGLMALLTSCGEKQIDENLQKAFELHNEAVKVRQATKNQIERLKSNTDSLFVATYGNEINSLSSALEEWDEQLIEVPGFEDEHNHSHHDHSSHDHNHDHEHHEHGGQELTSKQHLEVQQHLLEEIKELAEKLEGIKQ